jgi:hypothetical protein
LTFAKDLRRNSSNNQGYSKNKKKKIEIGLLLIKKIKIKNQGYSKEKKIRLKLEQYKINF